MGIGHELLLHDQLGGIEEVTGSIPVSPTQLSGRFRTRNRPSCFLCNTEVLTGPVPRQNRSLPLIWLLVPARRLRRDIHPGQRPALAFGIHHHGGGGGDGVVTVVAHQAIFDRQPSAAPLRSTLEPSAHSRLEAGGWGSAGGSPSGGSCHAVTSHSSRAMTCRAPAAG